jgi:translocation and assembly module TamA
LTRRLAVPATALLLSLAGPAAKAADPVNYTVTLAETDNADLDQALADSSLLMGLREEVPAGPFALVVRAQEDAERFATALRSLGYYQGKAAIIIAGRPLDDPGLPDRLQASPADPPVPVEVSVEPGPQFHLGKISIEGPAPLPVASDTGLATGAPALATEALAGQDQLLNALRGQGYALAKVEPPVAYLREDAKVLDLVFKVDSGPRVDLGAIEIKGLKRMNEAFVLQRLLVHPGERYDPAALDQARRDLVSLGVFSSVRVENAEALDPERRLPIRFAVSERPLRAANLSAAYSTDLGGSFAVHWQHRNLFGDAEQLDLTAGMTQLGGNSTTGIGYNGVIAFVKPDFLTRDQVLRSDFAAVKQDLIAYNRQSVGGSLALNRKLAEHWSYGLGLAGERERVTQEGKTQYYTLLSLPLSLKYDDTDSLLDPTQGTRAAASATPTQPLAGPQTDTFVTLQVSGSAYFDLGEPGRSVLALRGLLGEVVGASTASLPPDKRFYAGGSATVRGYKYLSIGPQFPDHKPKGGTAVAAGTLEFRQRILDSYGVVAFVDAGQVAANGLAFTGNAGVGAGLGARYYTSIGPIRLDVAVPVVRVPDGGSFEVYIGLGQAF